MVTTDNGENLVTCLNPYDMSQQYQQRTIGVAVATSGTVTCVLVVAGAVAALMQIKREFRSMERLVEAERRANGVGMSPSGGREVQEGATVEMLPK